MTITPSTGDTQPLTDEELAEIDRLWGGHQTYVRDMLAEIRRLRAMKCATCGKRIGYINYKGYLLGWGCADGEECAENAMASEVDRLRAELAETRRVSECNNVAFQKSVDDLTAVNAALLAEVDRLRAELVDWRVLVREGSRIGMENVRKHDALAAELAAVDELHQPYDTPDDPHASRRCKGCIAGYDPRTGNLVHCAWPCPTKRVRAALGETGGTENG